jgi:hypothetical protein
MKYTFTSIILAAVLMCGCRSIHSPGPSSSAAKPVVDPCSARLHDIGGAILLYYALNRRMPARLEDVADLADLDAPLNFTCPLSGRPYLYNPKGLAIPGTDKRIIVYDSTPAHDGQRRCLLMPPITPGKAVSTDVQSFPEKVFSALPSTPLIQKRADDRPRPPIF